jgi:flagellar motor switch protein FliN
VSWESLDWQVADSQTLGPGAPLLDLWPMLKSAIAEAISADALCSVTIGDLLVGNATPGEAPTPLVAAQSFELLGTDRRGSWAALDPAKGNKIGAKQYAPDRLQNLVLEALSGGFESILGEALRLGGPVEVSSAEAPLLLLRLPMTSVDNEEVVLVSAYDAAVAGELAAHITALQALAAEASAPAPVAPAVPAVPAAAERAREVNAPAAPRPTPAAPMPTNTPVPTYAPASDGAGNGGMPAPQPNVRPAQFGELTPASTGQPGYNIDLLLGVNLQVAVEIGRTTLAIRDVLGLTPGSIVELDKLAGEKVDVLINGRPIAQGEVVVVDENFGVRITDVVSRQQRLSPAGGR